MVQSRWILLSTFLTLSAFGGVSFQEKENRVQYLEEITQGTTALDIETFRRELEYEKLNLPPEVRAKNEANLLAEKIKLQVHRSYLSALEENSPEEAFLVVKENIDRDLLLIAPDLQEEIRTIAMGALADSQTGVSGSFSQVSELEGVMLKGVQERMNYLNQDCCLDRTGKDKSQMMGNLDTDQKEYKNKAELVAALVSDASNTRFASTAHIGLRSEDLVRADSRISLRVKAEFLGVAVEAGPSFYFSRLFRTSVNIMAEGLNPVLGSDGNFDFLKRDDKGNPKELLGRKETRFIAFTCDAVLDYDVDYSGSGSFSVAGIGGSTSAAKSYSSSVTLSSRRIHVPESIGGQSVTYRDLRRLCHSDFLRAKVNRTLTVSGSLNIMMRNAIRSLVFSHPKNRCLRDGHCYTWFNKTTFSNSKKKIFPRCLEDRAEKYRSCFVRGLPGQDCHLFEDGKLISDGSGVHCDRNLRCVKYEEKRLFFPAKGRCEPINPRTYVNPYTTVKRR